MPNDKPQTTKKKKESCNPHVSDQIMVYLVIPVICYGLAACFFSKAFQ